MPPAGPSTLEELPPGILLHVLEHLAPRHVARLQRCSRALASNVAAACEGWRTKVEELCRSSPAGAKLLRLLLHPGLPQAPPCRCVAAAREGAACIGPPAPAQQNLCSHPIGLAGMLQQQQRCPVYSSRRWVAAVHVLGGSCACRRTRARPAAAWNPSCPPSSPPPLPHTCVQPHGTPLTLALLPAVSPHPSLLQAQLAVCVDLPPACAAGPLDPGRVPPQPLRRPGGRPAAAGAAADAAARRSRYYCSCSCGCVHCHAGELPACQQRGGQARWEPGRPCGSTRGRGVHPCWWWRQQPCWVGGAHPCGVPGAGWPPGGGAGGAQRQVRQGG
jgi:hypothetical protein